MVFCGHGADPTSTWIRHVTRDSCAQYRLGVLGHGLHPVYTRARFNPVIIVARH